MVTWRRCNVARAPASGSAHSAAAGWWSTPGAARRPNCRRSSAGHSFPEHWRVVVVLDPQRQGVHGADEINAFARLAPMSASDAAHLCRLVLMKALPAVAEDDLVSFGSAITELQARLGDYFAPTQGGHRFSSPDVAAALRHLEAQGACGIGQSSWGPTGFAFAESEAQANQLVAIARQHFGQGLDIRVCAGLNRGAECQSDREDATNSA